MGSQDIWEHSDNTTGETCKWCTVSLWVQGCIFWHYFLLPSFINRWNIVISFLKIISKLSARKIDEYIFMYVWVLKYNLTGLSTLVYPKSRIMFWFPSITLQVWAHQYIPSQGSNTNKLLSIVCGFSSIS